MEAEQEEIGVLLGQAYAEKNQQNMLDYGAKAKELMNAINDGYKELEKMMEEEEAMKKEESSAE